jgi:hypothetical protein
MRRGRIERLADRAGLGAVEAVYGPRIAPLLWFTAGVPASLAATALWERFGAPGDAGPGRLLWPLVGVTFAAVCLALAVATALDRGRRIAVCREGLLHVRRSRLDVVPWTAVRHLRRRARTVYELDADDGVTIAWNEELRGHRELFEAVERRVTPHLLETARERLTAGDHVAFDGLVVSAAGLTAEGAIDPLTWDGVESVTFSPLGEAQVTRRGQEELWFAGLVPDLAVLRALMDELLRGVAER